MKLKTFLILLSDLLLYILAMYTGYNVLWIFAIFISIITISSLIMFLSAIFLLKFDMYVSYPIITKGMDTNIVLKYINRTVFIYPCLKILYYDENEEEVTVFPGSNKHSAVFRPPLKGVYDIGVERILITDFFDFFTYSFKIKNKEKIHVMPRVREYDLFRANESNDYINKEIKVNKIEDKNIISDLREYKYGDTLNKINWKATAKFNDVIVNNYENRFSPKTFIYVGGLNDEKGENEEESLVFDDFACELAITLINNIVSENGHLSILYSGKENILDSAAVKSFSEYGMYLTERTLEDTHDQDLTTIENMVINTSGYNKVIFIVNIIYKDIYGVAKALKSKNVDVDIFKISKLNDKKLYVSKVNVNDSEREENYYV